MGCKRALICGYYGQGNAGDEALLVALLQMLPTGVEPIVISANPSQTQQLYGVASCPRTDTFTLLKAFKYTDLFIWGGGSLMQDVTSLKSPIYYASLMSLAQAKKLKTVAWAQGIGPLNSAFSRWLTKRVLKGCTAVSVRDNKSAQIVKEWGIEALIAPDPVWALNAKPLQLELLSSPRVAVALRSHPLLTSKRLAILTQALLNFQAATNASVLLIPFQPAKDLAIAQAISQKLPVEKQQIIDLTEPRELKAVFQTVKMTIGMRYHSLIMAGSEGSICFALSYDPKVTQLMQELNLPGWELSQLPNEAEVITQAWLE
ncbi:MAG: polysaccharide pyruvyl transferase CsaB, partial [Cyanobacteria bacterium J083]